MSKKKYDVTIPFTLWLTVRVSVPDADPNAKDPNDTAIEEAYEAVGKTIYMDALGGIATQWPAVHLRFDDEFQNPWEEHDIDVVEVTEDHDD